MLLSKILRLAGIDSPIGQQGCFLAGSNSVFSAETGHSNFAATINYRIINIMEHSRVGLAVSKITRRLPS